MADWKLLEADKGQLISFKTVNTQAYIHNMAKMER